MAGDREMALRNLVLKWRALYAEDEPDYYAGQYSRADECADDLEAALSLPPDPAPGMAETERLVDSLERAVANLMRSSSGLAALNDTRRDARAALLAAVRALAAPGPDRYAEGWRAGREDALITCKDVYDLGRPAGLCAETRYGWDLCALEIAERLRALPVPEPAPAGEKEGGDV